MSWRIIVISNSAKLDYKMDCMVVRQEQITKIHLNEIYMLIVESTAVSVTASLLSELMKRKIKVIFCDEKRNPSGELLNYYGSHDTSNKYRQQLKWRKEIKDIVWTEIVADKIRQQSLLLKELNKQKESLMLKEYINDIAVGDGTTQSHLIGVFQFIAYGNAASDDAQPDAERRQFAVKVEIGGVAFHRGTEREDDFLDSSFFHSLHKAVYLQVIGTYPVHGRDDAPQHMVHAMELLGGFDGHHVAYVLHHAHHRSISRRGAAYLAQFRVGYVVAFLAVFDFLFQRGKGIGKCFHGGVILPQQVKHEAHGSLPPDARQFGKFLYGFFQQERRVLLVHVH